MSGRILIVDDDRGMCDLIDADMRLRGFETVSEVAAEEAFTRLKSEPFDVVLTDLNMPGMNGLALCDRVKTYFPDVPVVVITAFGSMETAIAAIRAGAYDFVTKPIEMDMLAICLERAVNHHALREQVKTLSEAVHESRQYGELIGASPPMFHLYEQIARVADSESSVLVVGESGTGKELVARIIHSQSRRADRPFVAVNCANLPDTLLESELFGHARGAFTDAREDRRGLLLQANGGTLVLDEIGEFPLSLQPKVLRALEERRLRPVGGDREIPFDVRILSITNRDLESAVEKGRFRKDLYFRVNVIQLELPPLRARGTDILLIAQHFVDQFRRVGGKNVVGISEPAAQKLLAYDWPGNVRELRNIVERAVALTRHEKITIEDLPEKIQAFRPSQILIGGTDPAELVPLEEVERRYILHVLKMFQGNRTLAARTLGLDRKTLYRKLLAYGIAE